MEQIKEAELKEIIKSYGLDNLLFDDYVQVEPDTAVYIFHNDQNIKFCLVTADFLGGYEEKELPYIFEYDYYKDRRLNFRATRCFSYIEDAPKRAVGYIDDKKLWTKASTGDNCMLFECEWVDKIKN